MSCESCSLFVQVHPSQHEHHANHENCNTGPVLTQVLTFPIHTTAILLWLILREKNQEEKTAPKYYSENQKMNRYNFI